MIPSSKNLVYICIDPEGYRVFLEKDCWYGHILKRHQKQMAHRLYDIKSTIENPDDVVVKVENGVQNRVYFKRWRHRDPYGQEYLKVPTEVVGDRTARILTAHPVATIPY